MDMTSLSSTLPGSSNTAARQQRNPQQPSPEPSSTTDDSQALIEAFQSAARSVTHLYRSSASLIRNSRQEGYTDALSDVLEAIDNESAYKDPALALSRIRDWVIDRRHEIRGGPGGSGSGGRTSDMQTRHRRETSAESDLEDGSTVKEEDRREEQTRQSTGYSETQQQPQPLQSVQVPSQQTLPFTFQSLEPLPQYPIHSTDIIETPQSPGTNGTFTFNSPVVQPPQSQSRHTTSKGPLTPRSGNSNSNSLGTGAGTKRRNQYMDYFDMSSFGNFNFNSRDSGNGGGGNGNSGGYPGQGNAKRGRFV